jgi:site-specific DNA-methyltransferase (adenine-specific)
MMLTGDCLLVLKEVESDSVDLIVTSPPYAGRRDCPELGYVDWFITRSAQFHRVLKPTGSFVLNIKERVSNGERRPM